MIAHAIHILAALPLGLAAFLTMRLAGLECFERHKLWLTLPEHGRFWPRTLREMPYDRCLLHLCRPMAENPNSLIFRGFVFN